MKKVLAVFAAVLLLASSGLAQSAPALRIGKEDQAKARRAWQEYQTAKQAWRDAKAAIAAKYVPSTKVQYGSTVSCSKDDGGFMSDCKSNDDGQWTSVPDEGWQNGVEFSKDFGVIVPKPAEPPPCSNLTLTPYVAN